MTKRKIELNWKKTKEPLLCDCASTKCCSHKLSNRLNFGWNFKYFGKRAANGPNITYTWPKLWKFHSQLKCVLASVFYYTQTLDFPRCYYFCIRHIITFRLFDSSVCERTHSTFLNCHVSNERRQAHRPKRISFDFSCEMMHFFCLFSPRNEID